MEAVKWRDMSANLIRDLANLLPVGVLQGRVQGILKFPNGGGGCSGTEGDGVLMVLVITVVI